MLENCTQARIYNHSAYFLDCIFTQSETRKLCEVTWVAYGKINDVYGLETFDAAVPEKIVGNLTINQMRMFKSSSKCILGKWGKTNLGH